MYGYESTVPAPEGMMSVEQVADGLTRLTEQKPATSYAQLRQYAHETDKLLDDIDRALARGLIQNDAAWGKFAREFSTKAAALSSRSGSIEPMHARLVVGSVAGYVEQLLIKRDDRKFRDYVTTVVKERDEYLDSIRPEGSTIDRAIASASDASDTEPITPEFVTWTDATGKFSVEAAFKSFATDHVTLVKRDGADAKVPIDRLSDESKEQLKEILRVKGVRKFEF
ncbi:SHD1 domain-containing protein [Planctomycetes bacterium TBK1r]|uniref:SLA1 homology domain-containing protein n=1 Tax=Stieleria magnilauensis TaxID=2527963 RepID=A0ABX5XYR6_9BACT|nr:hypothetical protein TBK1r_62120 [Planctomycetes bacterium TBK1r]